MTAAEVIRRYGLAPHPEGGHYREVHRSRATVGTPPGYPGDRCALTAIHFLLASGEFSALHRVRGEEAWVHLAGSPLELAVLDAEARVLTVAPAPGGEPLAVVAPGALQGARCLGDWTLVTCLVAPGFDFADFQMPSRAELLREYPAHADLVRRFTR